METEELTDAEVFTEAARLIETYGWRQGSNGDRERGFCMAGALMVAVGMPPHGTHLTHPREAERWADVCAAVTGELVRTPGTHCQMGGLTTWNDRPDRKKTDVTAFLRELAEKAA